MRREESLRMLLGWAVNDPMPTYGRQNSLPDNGHSTQYGCIGSLLEILSYDLSLTVTA